MTERQLPADDGVINVELDVEPASRPRVAIVGFAAGHYDEAPFGDPLYEIWGLNSLHRAAGIDASKFHRWFNLHDLKEHHGDDEDHLKFLSTFHGEVVLRAEDIGKYPIEASPFPRQAMIDLYGNYFNNTISWLIALAITLDFEEIALFGVDMAQDGLVNAEYSHQRPSCEFFVGIAAGRGIRIRIPDGSDLLKTPFLYGWEDGSAWTQKLMNRLKELNTRKAQVKQSMAEKQAELESLTSGLQQLDGAMQDVQYWLRNWAPNPPTKKE